MRLTSLFYTGKALLAFLLVTMCALQAQAQQTTYRLNYNVALLDLPGGLVENSSNNYVFAGTNTSFLPIYGTVTEVDQVGNVVWSKGYAGSIATQFDDIKALSGGGYIACGSSDPGIILMNLSSTGTVNWSYRYQVTSAADEYASRVLPTSDGGFVVAGYVYGADPDGAGPFVRQDSANLYALKVDANGAILWSNVFFVSTSYINDHALYDVAEVSDGYIFVGASSTNGTSESRDAVVLKTNLSGVRQWSYRFGGSNGQYAQAIKRRSGTEVVITGEDNGEPFYIRMSSAGAVLGGSRYEFGIFSLDQAVGTDIITTNDGNLAIYGTYIGFGLPPVISAFILKVAPTTGAIQFQKYFATSGSGIGLSLLPEGIQATDSSYMLLSTTFGTAGGYDYELIKADKNGLLNSPTCNASNLSLSRSSYSPSLTSFTPLVTTSTGRTSFTPVVLNLGTTMDSVCLNIVCNAPAAPTSVTATNNNFCPGLSTTINASGPASNVTYNVYTTASGGSSIGSTPLAVSPTTTTTYYVEASDNSNPLCVSGRVSVTVTVLPPPPAQPGAISGPNPTCPGSRSYTINAVPNASVYTWNVSGGGSVTGTGTTTGTINWITPGTHTISVTATNSCGTSATRTLSVTVGNPPPAQPGAITGATNPCPGTEGYSIAAVTNAASYNWSVSGGGTISGTGTTASVNWTTPGGPYTISVTATNGCGTSAARTITVNVQNGPPTAIGSISGNTNVCVGSQSYTVPAVSGATGYSWSVGSGGSITAGQNTNAATINWTSAGTHTVSVTASNPCGNVSATPISVTVVGGPPATPGPVSGADTACTGNHTYTIPAATGADSYSWSISGGGTTVSGAASTSYTVNWTSAGTHTISVTATNACGTTSAATYTVLVLPSVPPVPGPINGSASVCAGSESYSISPVSSASAYTWTVSGGGTIASGQGTTGITVNWTTSGGPYTVSVIPTNICGNGSSSDLSVTVLPANPPAPASISGNTPVCPGTEAYTVAAVNGANSYTWSVSGGGSIAGTGTTGTATWTTPGTWTVSVTANNQCGSSTATTTTVVVSDPPPAQPGSITGNINPCPGTEAYNITPVTGATTYNWTLSGGGTITGSGASISVDWTTSGGPYTLSVTAENGCGTSAARTLTVNVQNGQPTTIGSISGNTNVCVGSQSYSVPAVTGAASYTWSVGSGGSVTGGQNTNSAAINWTNAGTHTVSVTASNPCGSVSATPISVTVVGGPPTTPGPVAGADTVCTGNQTYTIPTVANADSYNWSISGGGTTVSGANSTSYTVNWTTGGTHTISVTATNACGTSSAATYTVQVSPSVPTAPGAITGSNAVCAGSESYSIIPVTGASGYTWTISGGGSIVSGQGTTGITVNWTTTGGPYTVSVIPTNVCGNGSSADLSVTVLPANPAAPDSILGNTPVCFGNEIYTAATVVGASSYTWSVSGGGSIAGTGTTGTASWTTPGTWTVSATANNQCGSSAPTTTVVEVLPANPITPGSISGPTAVCPGTEGYSIGTVPGATGYTWSISGGGTIVSGQGTDSIDVQWASVLGSYTISVTANNQCGSSSAATTTVLITPGPPTGTPLIAGNNGPCPGLQGYSVSGVTGAGTYTWSVSGGGSIINGQGTDSVTINWTTTGGPYTISVTPSNTCGAGTDGTYNVTVGGPPDIGATVITGDSTPCPGNQTYSIPAVPDATGYTWTLSGGGSITGGQGSTSVTVNWTTPGGPYTLSVTADNACGSSAAVTQSVTVQPGTPAQPSTITGPANICEGAGVATYSITGVANTTNYTWSVSGGGSVTSGQGTTTAGITWTGTPGSYTISVTAGNNCGTSTAATLTITIDPGAPAQPGNITGAVNVCPGVESYSITNVANATSYNWSLSGGGSISSGQGSTNIAVSWTTSGGPYTISVTATNNCGTSTAQTLSVTVQASPTAPVVTTSGDTICEGESATITASGSTGGNITYNIYDSQTGGTLLGVSPLTVSPITTTTYYVEVINDAGCRFTGGRQPATVFVSPAILAPTITGGNEGVCFEGEATLTASVTGGGNISWWNAASGDTLLGTGNSFGTGQLTSTTTFYVEATSSNGCGSLTGRVAATVAVAEQPTVTLGTDAEDNTIFINQALLAIADPADYSQYEFFLNGAQVQIDSINTWASSVLEDGDVIGVIPYAGGCVGELVEITIQVNDFPNVFTPNGDGRNDVFLKGFDLVIMNRWGQELYNGQDGWDGTFNGDRVSPGTYFYIVRVADITDKENVLKGAVLVHF